jgi:hypothetical protein
MNARRHNLANILAVGVVATVLLLMGLFWVRTLCSTLRHNWLFHAVPEVRVGLSRLFPWERGNDPNLVRPYLVTARPQPDAPLLAGLGVVQYAQSRVPTGPDSCIYRWKPGPEGESLYYDRALGQIVYNGTKKVTDGDGKPALVAHFTYCAGPEGVALLPDEKLGRFVDPIVNRFGLRPFIVYDRGLTRFFAIDWTGQVVRKGPELPKDGRNVPVQIGVLEKNPQSLHVMYLPGSRREPYGLTRDGEGPDGQSARSTPNVVVGFISMSHHMPVLDASGRIDWLDVNTLELARSEMRLPVPRELYPRRGMATPHDIAAYSALPISIHPPGAGGTWTYGGCAMAALSRDGTSVRLEVFDPNGRVVASDETEMPQYAEASNGEIVPRSSLPSTQAAYFRLPGAYGLTLAKLALESMHPPILLLLSYFPASKFEATAGYRSLLLLPDSFLAMRARDKEGRPVEEFFASMVFMIPAFVLVLLLAWRVDRDGGRIGLSKNERTAWVAGTVVFGLPAYITYRLTRPKVTLVTCTNCGVGRRPDLEKCHHCGSPWVVPELVPPAWRVLGEQEPAEDGSPSEAQPASSPAQ